MVQRTASVIGSGVAGLAVAIRLAVQGFSVTVFEKNDQPGGKLTAFTQEGFHFDAGPSLFTQPENLDELFAYAGKKFSDYVQVKPLDEACRYFFENGKQITGFTDADRFAAELNEKAGEDPRLIKRYLQRAGRLYTGLSPLFLKQPLNLGKVIFNRNLPKAIAALRPAYLFRTLSGYNNLFKSNEARKIFNRFATYNGSSPFRAPAMLSMIPHLEHNLGAYYPGGGMVSITNALVKLAKEKGVTFRFNAEVEKIIDPGETVKGIRVNNENVFSDLVVANADAEIVYNKLLHRPLLYKPFAKREKSSSAFVFYWGMNKQFPALGLHNIFFSKDYRAEFKQLFKPGSFYTDPTIYINITSKQEVAHAPAGAENWFVMVNIPADTSYDSEVLRARLKEIIITKLERMLSEELRSSILTEAVFHPKLIESVTGSSSGAIYGQSSNSRAAAFRRPPNKIKGLKNLYACGGSHHPGGGIPLCLHSAEIVSDLVAKQHKKSTVAHA